MSSFVKFWQHENNYSSRTHSLHMIHILVSSFAFIVQESRD